MVGRPAVGHHGTTFERFTDRARRVVVLAQEEARLLGHDWIGTEHLLLGLLHEGEGVAAEALESLGISLERVRAEVEEIIGEGDAGPSGHIPFTPRAKKVLELSLREALQLGHHHIGTEHVLLGLIREGEGIAAQVLVKVGAELERVRSAVLRLLSGSSPPEERGVAPRPTLVACSFCGREGERMVAGRGRRAYLCRACAAWAVDALAGDVDEEVARPFVDLLTGTNDELVALGAVEGGAELAETWRELRTRYPAATGAMAVHLRSTRPVSDDEAVASFWWDLGDSRLALEGRAVRAGGRWLVTRDTFYEIVRVAGVDPPGAEGEAQPNP
jgi:Clp amino terminal domain, pathogenicity island component